jgi:uncharacterized protein (DUF983 family)
MDKDFDKDFYQFIKPTALIRGKDNKCPRCGSNKLYWRYTMKKVFCRSCGNFFDFLQEEIEGKIKDIES